MQNMDKTIEFKTDTPIVVFEQLCKSYLLGTVELHALRNIDLTIWEIDLAQPPGLPRYAHQRLIQPRRTRCFHSR